MSNHRKKKTAVVLPITKSSSFLISAEVRAILRCSRRTLLRLYHGYTDANGKFRRPVLGSMHRGGRVLFEESELRRFIVARTRTAAIVIFLGLFLLPAAKAQTVPNRFHYGAEYKTTIGEQARSFRTAYCNTDGQEVGSLTVTAFTTGVGDFSLIPEHASNIDERDVRVGRTYETAAQAKRAGEKYAAVVFNHACGIGK